MCFYFASLLVHDTTQFAFHRFERVMNHFVERLVRAVVRLPFVGDQFVAPRHGHIDAAPVWITFLMGVIGLLDGHITAVDVVAKFFEPRGVIQNEVVDLVRFFQTPIRYVNRQLHNYLDTTALLAVVGTKNLGSSIPFKFAATIGNG